MPDYVICNVIERVESCDGCDHLSKHKKRDSCVHPCICAQSEGCCVEAHIDATGDDLFNEVFQTIKRDI